MREFTLLYFAHTVGDFFLQTEALSEKKKANGSGALIHSLVYALALFSTLVIYRSPCYLASISLCAVTHAAIDLDKPRIERRLKRRFCGANTDATMFALDQAAHTFFILIGAAIAANNADRAFVHGFILNDIRALTGFDGFYILAAATLILMSAKPANLFIERVLAPFNSAGAKSRDLTRGRSIGTLERCIMAALLMLGQYAAIAVVFSAKSLARFKELDDRAFAEYYLLGTLTSAALCLYSYALFRVFGTL